MTCISCEFFGVLEETAHTLVYSYFEAVAQPASNLCSALFGLYVVWFIAQAIMGRPLVGADIGTRIFTFSLCIAALKTNAFWPEIYEGIATFGIQSAIMVINASSGREVAADGGLSAIAMAVEQSVLFDGPLQEAMELLSDVSITNLSLALAAVLLFVVAAILAFKFFVAVMPFTIKLLGVGLMLPWVIALAGLPAMRSSIVMLFKMTLLAAFELILAGGALGLCFTIMEKIMDMAGLVPMVS